MAITCIATGAWDAVKGSAPFYSREQYRATVLLILCQGLENLGIVPDMSACTVSGLWDQVRGTPPFMSEEQFMATHINLLCQFVDGGGGGGGGGFGGFTGSNTDYAGSGSPPAGITTLHATNGDGVVFLNRETAASPDWTQI